MCKVVKKISKIKILSWLCRPFMLILLQDDTIEGRIMEENNKVVGRPLTSEKPRTIRFAVRLDEKEHQELQQLAKQNNMTSAEFIRYLIKKEKNSK